MDDRIPESKRLALSQQTVKYQLTLIGASFTPLFIWKCSCWDSSRVKYWNQTRLAILHVNEQLIIWWHIIYAQKTRQLNCKKNRLMQKKSAGKQKKTHWLQLHICCQRTQAHISQKRPNGNGARCHFSKTKQHPWHLCLQIVIIYHDQRYL